MNRLPDLPAPNPKKQLQGAKNRAEGKAFEERLDASFAYYASRGYALIDKTPEPFKVIKRLEQTRFIGCYTKRAQPDYKGVIKGGRMVVFEAKYTSTDRITQDRVSDAQWSYMNSASDLGARCYVIIGFHTNTVYRIPWSLWTSMKEVFGRKYVTEQDLKQYQIAASWNDLLLILD